MGTTLEQALDLVSAGANPRHWKTLLELCGDLSTESVSVLADALSAWPDASRTVKLHGLPRDGRVRLARSLFLHDGTLDDLIWLSESGHLTHLHSLFISGRLTEEHARVLARAPSLRTLSRLTLTCLASGIGADGLRWLVDASQLTSMTHLSVSGAGLGPDMARALTPLELPALRSLHIDHDTLGESGVAALATTASLSQLSSLGIRNAEGGSDATARLVTSPHLSSLRELSLAGNEIGDVVVEQLATAGASSVLTSLDLSHNDEITDRSLLALSSPQCRCALTEIRAVACTGIGDAGLHSVASSTLATRLETLDLSMTSVGTGGMAALASARTLPRLARLDLSYAMMVEQEGVRALADLALPVLRELSLGGTGAGDVGTTALASADWPLRVLRLDSCGITCGGAGSLAQAPFTTTLEHLTLRGNQIGDVGASALGAAPFDHLVQLDVRDNTMQDDGFLALMELPRLQELELSEPSEEVEQALAAWKERS
ncbi:MAG: hypothetical protein KTR31_32370 [Myxococcales bacterium]|nr:hypothetical protein [Myxococcales bacterium]